MLNSVQLQGRLASDPELRQTTTGVAVATFRIGIQRDYDRNKADWVNVIAWRQTAEFVKNYFRKGDSILIQGVLQSRTYEDKNKVKRYALEVVAQTVNFCGSKRAEESPTEYEDLTPPPDDSDLPF